MLCLQATESSENNYNEGTRFFESTYRMIVDDLIDEAILEVCFEVHHAAKWGYLDLEYPKLYVYLRLFAEYFRIYICISEILIS